MSYVRLRVSAAMVCAAMIAACGHPAGWFSSLPGDQCSDRSSRSAVRASYASWQSHLGSQAPRIVWPDLTAIRKVSAIPASSTGAPAKFHHCNGLAEFSDRSTKAIRFGWSRAFKPNWVSARSGLFWCIEGQHDGCPEFSAASEQPASDL